MKKQPFAVGRALRVLTAQHTSANDFLKALTEFDLLYRSADGKYIRQAVGWHCDSFEPIGFFPFNYDPGGDRYDAFLLFEEKIVNSVDDFNYTTLHYRLFWKEIQQNKDNINSFLHMRGQPLLSGNYLALGYFPQEMEKKYVVYNLDGKKIMPTIIFGRDKVNPDFAGNCPVKFRAGGFYKGFGKVASPDYPDMYLQI